MTRLSDFTPGLNTVDNCQMEEMGRNQTVLNSLPGEDIGWNRSILDAPNLKFFNTADFVKKSELNCAN